MKFENTEVTGFENANLQQGFEIICKRIAEKKMKI